MNCRHTRERPSSGQNGGAIISSIFLAILPKCPICYVTLSSSITICGLAQSESLAMSKGLVSILLVVVLISLLFSFRGVKTALALSLVIFGGAVILWGELQVSTLTSYYLGSSLVVIGSLVNRRSYRIRIPKSIQHSVARLLGS